MFLIALPELDGLPPPNHDSVTQLISNIIVSVDIKSNQK